MNLDPARTIVGLATTFGRRGADGLTLERHHLDGFLTAAPAVPLLESHHGWKPRGTVHQCKAIPDLGSVPAGLLILAETVDAQLAADIHGWALSIRATVRYLDPELTRVRDAWITEVSFVDEGADEIATVLATGPAALRTWELLTGGQVLAHA